jgi:hypothetical protein
MAQLIMGLTELNVMAPVLAAVHGISVGRTLLVLGAFTLVLILLVIVFYVLIGPSSIPGLQPGA